MNEVEFRNWLAAKEFSKKIQADNISRLRTIERELNHCDLDKEYDKDHCYGLLSIFEKRGNNEKMKKYPSANFPIGKSYMSVYRHAIRKYIQFRESL